MTLDQTVQTMIDASLAPLQTKVAALEVTVAKHEAELMACRETFSIVGVDSSGETTSGAVISWSLSKPGTGQVEYGTTTAYGSTSTLDTSPKTSHRHTLSGLSVGTLYHYRVIGTGPDGTYASADYTFTTSVVASASGSVFGGGITMRGLANVQVGGSSGSSPYSGPVQAQQFRAERSLAVTSVRLFKISGVGYSGGNGGSGRVRIMGDVGGVPNLSGTVYGTLTKTTANSSAVGDSWALTSPVALTAGSLYWVVWDKVTPGDGNYVGWDGVHVEYDTTYVSRVHPRWADTDCRWRGGNGTTWGYVSGTGYGVGQLSTFQVTYSDGHAQGNSYMEIGEGANGITGVSGTTYVRQTFEPYDSLTVVGVGLRATRTGAVGVTTAALKTIGGSTLQTATFTGSQFPVGTNQFGGGGRWIEASFPEAQALSGGTEYALWFQNTSGAWNIANLRKGSVGFGYSDKTEWPQGRAQRSTNSGSSWSDVGIGNYDLPAYLKVQ